MTSWRRRRNVAPTVYDQISYKDAGSLVGRYDVVGLGDVLVT